MSTSSSSRSSIELTPRLYYHHEHPVLTYSVWKQNVLSRLQLPNEGGVQDYRQYVEAFTTHKRQRDNNGVLFRYATREECTCYLFEKIRACYHILTASGSHVLGKAMSNQLETSAEELLTVFFQDGARCAKECPTGIFSKCANCAAVLRTKSADKVPHHSCSQRSLFKYLTSSNFRYKMPFKTPHGERIILDSQYCMLHYSDLHLLTPICSDINIEIERLGLRTNTLQLCLQDPAYLEMVSAIDTFNQFYRLGVYSLYLYLKFRLLPYLSILRPEILSEKLIPVFTMITTENPEKRETVLGYDVSVEEEKLMKQVPLEIKEDVAQLLTELKKGHDEDYIYNRVCDETLRESTTDISQQVIKILNVSQPIYPALSLIAQSQFNEGRWERKRLSQWNHMYDEGDLPSPLYHLTNIFGVLPSTNYSIPLTKPLTFVALFGPPRYRTRWQYSEILSTRRQSTARKTTFNL